MKLVNFRYNANQEGISFGVLEDDYVIDLKSEPTESFIKPLDSIKKLIEKTNEHDKISSDEVTLVSPILRANSLRDAYAFRQHVEAGRRCRVLNMIPEYDKFPVFYYGNHNAITGPGEVQIQKDQSVKLDYELEIAAIIGKEGENLSVDEADDYIMGYTIMNDLSARALQKEEMKLSLGPA